MQYPNDLKPAFDVDVQDQVDKLGNVPPPSALLDKQRKCRNPAP